MITCLSLGFASLTLAQAQVVFTDDFNRADGAVGNGWTVTSLGNVSSGGGGTAPTATIVSNQLALARAGWGPDASIVLSHSSASFASATTSITLPTVTGGTAAGAYSSALRVSNSVTGAFIRVELFELNTSNQFAIRIASSADSSWPGWTKYYPTTGTITNPGTLSVNITTIDSAGVFTVSILNSDNTSLLNWSSTNTGLAGSTLDTVSLLANWTAWTSPTGATPTFDAITLSSIPEPSSVALVGLGSFGWIVTACARTRMGRHHS
ncbi:MAG: hypothetical protein B9S32_07205 [Verrucomicrobia bacterium Tous-C9LFEB]|nr:MAG: hypothetical protein B9S32_07205 [Verrucomicrobia bacterium Tous-C9LFEB]